MMKTKLKNRLGNVIGEGHFDGRRNEVELVRDIRAGYLKLDAIVTEIEYLSRGWLHTAVKEANGEWCVDLDRMRRPENGSKD